MIIVCHVHAHTRAYMCTCKEYNRFFRCACIILFQNVKHSQIKVLNIKVLNITYSKFLGYYFLFEIIFTFL